jgi:hypothetical protein
MNFFILCLFYWLLNKNIKYLIAIQDYNELFCMFKKPFEHSSLAFSLTYLRGLEVSELEEEGMS